jgi:hypothetical protein
MVAAKDSVRRAREKGTEMEQTGTPDSKTFIYRRHMKNAEKAVEERKWKKADIEATNAQNEAQRILDEREKLSGELKERLDKIKATLQSSARPSGIVVERYFDAIDAIEIGEYEKAAAIMAQTETILIRDFYFKKNQYVIIDAPLLYWNTEKTIPLYENVSNDGTPGREMGTIKETVKVRFLESRYINRDRNSFMFLSRLKTRVMMAGSKDVSFNRRPPHA